MKNVVALGASSSEASINKQFASWVAQQVNEVEVDVLDLNDFEMPLYSVDLERLEGVPQKAVAFRDQLQAADGIVISFAEHNGSYTAAFKNIFDWFSRIQKPIWMEKPMLLLAAAPGPRGGKNVLDLAVKTFPYQGGNVAASFSLPKFRDNFSAEEGIVNPELKSEFEEALRLFTIALEESREQASRVAS